MSDDEIHNIPSPTEEEMRIADEQFDIIALSQGLASDGKTRYWAYILVSPSKYEAFVRAKPPVNLEDYGTIVRAGTGDEPPEEVKKEMEIELGADHSIEEQIIDMSVRVLNEQSLRTKYNIPPKIRGYDDE